MAWPQTPLPNPNYPNADRRLFNLSAVGLPGPFLEKALEIVKVIVDEGQARTWLHDNGISGIKITTPFWSIDTRETNFWTQLSDTLTPVIVKAVGTIPILGQVFTNAVRDDLNPVVTRLPLSAYQPKSNYAVSDEVVGVVNGKPVINNPGGSYTNPDVVGVNNGIPVTAIPAGVPNFGNTGIGGTLNNGVMGKLGDALSGDLVDLANTINAVQKTGSDIINGAAPVKNEILSAASSGIANTLDANPDTTTQGPFARSVVLDTYNSGVSPWLLFGLAGLFLFRKKLFGMS